MGKDWPSECRWTGYKPATILPRDLFQPVPVNTGETRAFFVTTPSNIIWFQEKMLLDGTGTSVSSIDYGDTAYFNSDLDLNVGTGVPYGFGERGPPNIFDGALKYTLV